MTMQNPKSPSIEDIAKNVGVEVEESHTALGTTPEFAWYEVEVLLKDMQQTRMWEARLKRLVDVMTAHRVQQDKMIAQLMDQNRDLKVKLGSYINRASS
jgi:hypothetical protein